MNFWRIAAILFSLFVAFLAVPVQTAQAAGVVSDCSTYGPGPGTLATALEAGGSVTFACDGAIVVPEIPIAIDTEIDAGGHDVTLSGGNTNRLFRVGQGVTLTLRHLTLSQGYSAGRGGAIYNDSGAVALVNVTLSANQANHGAGIFNAGGALTVEGSTFTANRAHQGGAIASMPGVVTVHSSTFAANSATYGGAIHHDGGSLAVADTLFTRNTAAYGAGLYSKDGSLTVNNTSFAENRAGGYGAGLYSQAGTVDLANSTFTANEAGLNGGAIGNDGGAVAVTNSTLSANRAGNGGGLYTRSGTVVLANSTLVANSAAQGGALANDGGAVRLANSILAQSSGSACAGPLESHNNLIDDESCGDRIGAVSQLDPQLADNGGRTLTHALLPGSNAVDAGANGCPDATGAALQTDQRGAARPLGAACDIGAFELEPPANAGNDDDDDRDDGDRDDDDRDDDRDNDDRDDEDRVPRPTNNGPGRDRGRDGNRDDNDRDNNSDARVTVTIAGCDSGVPNHRLRNGDTIAHLIEEARADARNRGRFVSTVTRLTNDWRRARIIDQRERRALLDCVRRVGIEGRRGAFP